MKRAALLCALALVAAAALPATASTFLGMTQAELVANSNAVVIGEVTDVRSFWNEEATAIVTEASFVVHETLAGEAPAIVVVRTFGGKVGPVYIEALGFPKFAQGQRSVLFLGEDGEATRVIGYQQGHWKVVTRHSDGVQVALPTVDDGALLITRDGTPAPRPRAMTLDTMRQQVREAAGALRLENQRESR